MATSNIQPRSPQSAASRQTLQGAAFDELPDMLPGEGFVRLPQVLKVIPVSRAAWWAGVASGKYPASIKLGPRTTCWKVQDIRALIDRLSNGGAADGE